MQHRGAFIPLAIVSHNGDAAAHLGALDEDRSFSAEFETRQLEFDRS
jgi:hypothetical protein